MLDSSRNREKELANFIQWAAQRPQVRAALLTSTLAVPGAATDALTDYDIILVLTDVRPFHQDRAWLEDFGPVLALYRDPLETHDDLPLSGYVVQFADGLKIDFTLWPVEMLRRIAAAPTLPDELDAGYRVLIDKDHLTHTLKPPTYRAYIPQPPTHQQYHDTLENFFLEAIYAAKYLWRDDLMAAKFVLDHEMKQEQLRPMLEWLIEIEHGWSVRPGPLGRGLKKWLSPDLWAELEATYAAAGLPENWEALFRTIALMRKVASRVGGHLGFEYPAEMDRRTVAMAQQIRAMPR